MKRGNVTNALAAAEKLTAADWGRAYPGNDPAQWEAGLNSFRQTIKQNIALAAH